MLSKHVQGAAMAAWTWTIRTMRAWVTWLQVWRAFTKSKATQISSLGRPIKYLYSCHFDSFLNRADYWALAGIVAVDKGIEISNVECGNADDCLVPQSGLVFQWGRQVSDNISLCTSFFVLWKDCSTSPNTAIDVGLPGSLLDHAGVMSFFFNGCLKLNFVFHRRLSPRVWLWRERNCRLDGSTHPWPGRH